MWLPWKISTTPRVGTEEVSWKRESRFWKGFMGLQSRFKFWRFDRIGALAHGCRWPPSKRPLIIRRNGNRELLDQCRYLESIVRGTVGHSSFYILYRGRITVGGPAIDALLSVASERNRKAAETRKWLWGGSKVKRWRIFSLDTRPRAGGEFCGRKTFFSLWE